MIFNMFSLMAPNMANLVRNKTESSIEKTFFRHQNQTLKMATKQLILFTEKDGRKTI